MFDFFKAVRETAASRTGAAAARRIRPELIHLKFEIDRTKCAIDAARNHFEQAVDPTLSVTSSCFGNSKARRTNPPGITTYKAT